MPQQRKFTWCSSSEGTCTICSSATARRRLTKIHCGLGIALISAKVGTFFATFNVTIGKCTDVLVVAINDVDEKGGDPSSGHYCSFHSIGTSWPLELI